MVKTMPPAMDSPAEPIVCTMLFSRIDDFPTRLNTAIARTAIGMDAETVRPARKARYTVEAPKMIPNTIPRMMALGVNSGNAWEEETNGLCSLRAGAAMALAECGVP